MIKRNTCNKIKMTVSNITKESLSSERLSYDTIYYGFTIAQPSYFLRIISPFPEGV